MRNKHIEIGIERNVPIIVWGPPGVGKTAHIRALARHLKFHLEVVLASVREPADFLGLPIIHDGRVRNAAPDWALRLVERGGILFFDEISTTPPAVQAALLRVILDRVVGDVELPSDIRIVAAANPPEWAAGGWELSPPLANRFAHVEWVFDPHEFVREFPGYWGNPPRVEGICEAEWALARSLVAGFLSVKPSLALSLPQSEEARGRAWPSPRSWDMVSRLIAGRSIPEIFHLVLSCIGEGTALEFFEWAIQLDLPNPADVLGNPAGFPLPERGDQVFTIATACAQYAVAIGTADLWHSCLVLMNRIAREGKADIAAAAMSGLAKNRPARLSPEQIQLMEPFVQLLKEANNE